QYSVPLTPEPRPAADSDTATPFPGFHRRPGLRWPPGRDPPRVEHPEGLPMRRANTWAILLLTAGPTAAAPAPDLAVRGTLTADDQGRFEVGGLDRGYHETFIVCPGRVRQRVLFDTTAKADTELDIPLPRAGRVVGRVTDEAGRPVPGANVGRGTSGSFFST